MEPSEIGSALTPLGFSITEQEGMVTAAVPSFRATGDVSIEADVVEEIARCIGFDTVEPEMPCVSIRRFPPCALHGLEQRTLQFLTTARAFHEIHGYIWYDGTWLSQLGIEPGSCLELRNPASSDCSRLRRSLMPGLLAAVTRNRFHFSSVLLLELGSVFEPGDGDGEEHRHVALAVARRGKGAEEEVHGYLKGAIENWAVDALGRQMVFEECESDPDRPWEHPHRTAAAVLEASTWGRVSVVDLPLRRAMDEHLESWSIAWAELKLDGLEKLPVTGDRLGSIPEHPLVEMDFSMLVPKETRYAQVLNHLSAFRHPLLKNIRYVTAYEGRSISEMHRSLTFRTIVGDDAQTLEETDTSSFRRAFEAHVRSGGFELRG